MNIPRKLKTLLQIITLPKDAIMIYDSYYLECYPTLSDWESFRDYKYKWRKIEPDSLGIYRLTNEYLSTNREY